MILLSKLKSPKRAKVGDALVAKQKAHSRRLRGSWRLVPGTQRHREPRERRRYWWRSKLLTSLQSALVITRLDKESLSWAPC